jgi:hypothetical protein
MSKIIDPLRGTLAANPCGHLIEEPVEYSKIDSADPPRRACRYDVAAREASVWERPPFGYGCLWFTAPSPLRSIRYNRSE